MDLKHENEKKRLESAREYEMQKLTKTIADLMNKVSSMESDQIQNEEQIRYLNRQMEGKILLNNKKKNNASFSKIILLFHTVFS